MTKRVRFHLDDPVPLPVHRPRKSSFPESSILVHRPATSASGVRARTRTTSQLAIKTNLPSSPLHVSLPSLNKSLTTSKTPTSASPPKSPKSSTHKGLHFPFHFPSHLFSSIPSFVSHLNSGTDLRLHHLLTFWPSFYPGIDFDVSFPASTAIAPKHSAHTLLEPATNPPVTSMVIQHPKLVWDIVATPHTPSSFFNGKHRPGREFVSVLDVLSAIYHTLRVPIDHSEYARIEPRAQTRVNAAYYARCDRIADPVARRTESERGVRRVDFLTGMNLFEGLTGPRDGNRWDLRVS